MTDLTANLCPEDVVETRAKALQLAVSMYGDTNRGHTEHDVVEAAKTFAEFLLGSEKHDHSNRD